MILATHVAGASFSGLAHHPDRLRVAGGLHRRARAGSAARRDRTVRDRKAAHPRVLRYQERPALEPERAAAYAARQTALAAITKRCTERVNPVVLPASVIGREGWLVYVLASSVEKGLFVLGGTSDSW